MKKKSVCRKFPFLLLNKFMLLFSILSRTNEKKKNFLQLRLFVVFFCCQLAFAAAVRWCVVVAVRLSCALVSLHSFPFRLIPFIFGYIFFLHFIISSIKICNKKEIYTTRIPPTNKTRQYIQTYTMITHTHIHRNSSVGREIVL